MIEDEPCCCVLGDIGLGILGDEVDDCGSCILFLAIIGLASVKLDVRGSRLDLEFPGDPACSGTVEEILLRLAGGSGDLARERERERLCLVVYPESRRDFGP